MAWPVGDRCLRGVANGWLCRPGMHVSLPGAALVGDPMTLSSVRARVEVLNWGLLFEPRVP